MLIWLTHGITSSLPSIPGHLVAPEKPIIPIGARRKRTAYSRNQLTELEAQFRESHFLTREKRCQLSNCLCLTERQVKIWFQNRRMKAKKRSLSASSAMAALNSLHHQPGFQTPPPGCDFHLVRLPVGSHPSAALVADPTFMRHPSFAVPPRGNHHVMHNHPSHLHYPTFHYHPHHLHHLSQQHPPTQASLRRNKSVGDVPLMMPPSRLFHYPPPPTPMRGQGTPPTLTPTPPPSFLNNKELFAVKTERGDFYQKAMATTTVESPQPSPQPPQNQFENNSPLS